MVCIRRRFIKENVGTTFFMGGASDNFDQVFRGWAALIRWVAILDFILGHVVGVAFSLMAEVPVPDVVLRGSISKEDAIVVIRVSCSVSFSSFLRCDAAAKSK